MTLNEFNGKEESEERNLWRNWRLVYSSSVLLLGVAFTLHKRNGERERERSKWKKKKNAKDICLSTSRVKFKSEFALSLTCAAALTSAFILIKIKLVLSFTCILSFSLSLPLRLSLPFSLGELGSMSKVSLVNYVSSMHSCKGNVCHQNHKKGDSYVARHSNTANDRRRKRWRERERAETERPDPLDQ